MRLSIREEAEARAEAHMEEAYEAGWRPTPEHARRALARELDRQVQCVLAERREANRG